MDERNTEYFHLLSSETPTEFWINNATLAEAKTALAAGARGATTNPTYMARLWKEEPDYSKTLIDETLPESADDDKIADLVYQKAIKRLQATFYPTFEETKGRFGYVAIQGDPRCNTDPRAIVEGALRYRQIGENIIIKVPGTPAGAAAMEELVARGIPTIATLCFSVDQAVYMAETYRRAVKVSSTRPLCYITFIAGILDEHLAAQAASQGRAVPADLIRHAGIAGTRVAYKLFQARAYEAMLIGGGARGPHHFTELVGGQMAITIGWGLAHDLMGVAPPVESRIHAETPPEVLAELRRRLPDFRKAIDEHSMTAGEFLDFGPVVRFQNTFLQGTRTLLDAITARRMLKSA